MDKILYKPAIVVVGYNRVESLTRLFNSLNKAVYPQNTQLIISLDFSDNHRNVVKCAEEFEWKAGNKRIIAHKKNLGLRQHILSCGDLSYEYGSVIILEDDLYVSPYFYDYSLQALDYYGSDKSIGGIALFSYKHIERKNNPEPFWPVADDSDVYFLQYACSSGQAWTEGQWQGFRQWYLGNPDISLIPQMPDFVLRWPERSWKKYFIAYLIYRNIFFVFPRYSLTVNFDDLGSNRAVNSLELQSILLMQQRKFLFKPIDQSSCIYDSHFEILPEIIKRFNDKLQNFDFEVDFYGRKNINKVQKEYMLTTRQSKRIIHSFARKLRPHEMNVIFDIQEGEQIVLAKTRDITHRTKRQKTIKYISDFIYFYRSQPKLKDIWQFSYFLFLKKFKRIAGLD